MTRLSMRKTTVFAGRLGVFATPAAPAADRTVGANRVNVPWEFEDSSGKVTGF